MIGLGKSLHPFDDLFDIVCRGFRQARRINVKRPCQRHKSLGHATSCGRLLAGNHVRPIALKHRTPPIASLMRQPIHLLRVQRRQSPRHPLTSQIVFLGMVPHVGEDRIIASLDTECVPARLLDQFAGVPQSNGQEFDETGRVGLLPGIVPFFSTPFDESGPAGEGRQLQR